MYKFLAPTTTIHHHHHHQYFHLTQTRTTYSVPPVDGICYSRIATIEDWIKWRWRVLATIELIGTNKSKHNDTHKPNGKEKKQKANEKLSPNLLSMLVANMCVGGNEFACSVRQTDWGYKIRLRILTKHHCNDSIAANSLHLTAMAIKVFGILCLIACSTASHYAYDYSPVYHQQPIAYIQPPTVYHAGHVATQVAPTVYHAAPVATQVAPAATLSTAPAAVSVVPEVVEYASAPEKYDFSYGVHDSLTGDIKSQRESRDGGLVQGSYSLIDADGYKRTVTYTADDVNGFNAVVHREPLTGVVAPIVAAQVPQQQYLPVAPAPIPIASAPAPVPVPVQQPTPVEQPIEEGEYAPAQQQPEPVSQQENNNFQISPQSDEDSEVIDAFGAASRSVSAPSESSLNQEEVATQQQQEQK